MKRGIKIITLTIVSLLLLSSCELDSNYRFADIEDTPTINPGEGTAYPNDGSLIFYENFQSWTYDGYLEGESKSCEDLQMVSSVIMYRPGLPLVKTYNDSVSVTYWLQDYAVNPTCGNMAGTSTIDSDVSRGYVALQQLIFYECGQHDSDASLTLSALSSISKIEFSVSYGGLIDDVGGLTLWKKTKDQTKFTKVGDYKPANPEEGEKFSVEINEKDVQIKFTPALSGKDNPINDGVNRAVRIHDLSVWSMNS